MSRFSCPCGLEADVPPDEMLDFVDRHECPHHRPSLRPLQPKTASQSWAGVAESLLFVVLILGVCSLCLWGLHR